MSATSFDRLSSALGHSYRIERELGQGGMATVYLAHDVRHDRNVALKVLRPELGARLGAGRFLAEIRITARLDHPHILTLIDSGESEGMLWYVLPYVRGESLRARLTRERQLGLDEALTITRQIAAALEYAHQQHVVHRDIKPENILLHEGEAMLADFGIALAVQEAGGDRLTESGLSLGTPQYMSPEQATGERQLDARSDVYSLGAVLYEMLAGEPPVTGTTAQAIIAKLLTERPTPLRLLRDTIPEGVEAAVVKALAKVPPDRHRSAASFAAALEAATVPTSSTHSGSASAIPPRTAAPSLFSRASLLAGAAAVVLVALVAYWRLHGSASRGAVRSIAVLPFENTSGDSTYNYFADGISDELRATLSGTRQLSVKARSSSLHFAGQPVRDVGDKLAVGAILQGTVSRSSTRLRVTAELVRVTDENTLWSGSFDQAVGDLASVQDSITRAIAGALRLTLAAQGSQPVTTGGSRGTHDVEAYDLYLKGQYYLRRFQLSQAAGFFRSAVARDPNFARAHASLAETYARLPTDGLAAPDSAIKLANQSLARAQALDSTRSEVRIAVAAILETEMRYAEQERAYAAQLRTDPENGDLYPGHAMVLGSLGHVEEALAESRRGHEVDPLNIGTLITTQYILYVLGRYREAVEATKPILDLEPRAVFAYQNLGLAYAFLGKPDSAVAAFEHAIGLDPQVFGGRVYSMFGYAVAGRWSDALRERRALESEERNSPNFVKAWVAVTFGQPDSAAAAIERGLADREPLFQTILSSCDPVFNPVKSQPRFQAAMRRLDARICPPVGVWPIASRGAPRQ